MIHSQLLLTPCLCGVPGKPPGQALFRQGWFEGGVMVVGWLGWWNAINRNRGTGMWWRGTHILLPFPPDFTLHFPPFRSPPWGSHLTFSQTYFEQKILLRFRLMGTILALRRVKHRSWQIKPVGPLLHSEHFFHSILSECFINSSAKWKSIIY